MSALRVAVVGAGHLGLIHARLLGSVEGVELVAVCDPSSERRNLCEQEFGVQTFASHLEILGFVDAAVIAAPTFLHFEVARELLVGGIDLMVEKPLTNNTKTAQQLVRLAESHRRVLQVGHIERFNPAWTTVRDRLGPVSYVEAVRASSFPGRCLDCGVVLDLMIHDLDLVLSLTDASVERVEASGRGVLTDREDIAEARLTFSDGMVANLRASRVAASATRQMQIFGQHGSATIDFSTPSATWMGIAPEIQEGRFHLNQTESMQAFRTELFQRWLPVEQLAPEKRNALLDELTDFRDAIVQKRAPRVTGRAGALAVTISDQILQSIATHRWTQPRPLRVAA